MSETLDCRAVPEGVLVALRVQPKASRARIVGLHGNALKLAVTEAPEKGKANEAVVELLADALGIAKSRLEITAGLASRNKTALVRGEKDAAAIAAKLLARVHGKG